jgi:hypothetical protein
MRRVQGKEDTAQLSSGDIAGTFLSEIGTHGLPLTQLPKTWPHSLSELIYKMEPIISAGSLAELK